MNDWPFSMNNKNYLQSRIRGTECEPNLSGKPVSLLTPLNCLHPLLFTGLVSFSGLKSINRSCTKHIHNEYNCWIGEKIPQSYARNQKKLKHTFLNDFAPWSMFLPTLRYPFPVETPSPSCQNICKWILWIKQGVI